jgi:type III restriction enzyme
MFFSISFHTTLKSRRGGSGAGGAHALSYIDQQRIFMSNLPLKPYQEKLLDAFAEYLSRVRETKSAELAFMECTEKAGNKLRYYPLHKTEKNPDAAQIPYVCFRVPTGGGKTRIAGSAIQRVNQNFLSIEYSLTLWLVPSETIRDQTLRVLKTPGGLLFEDMREMFGTVNVLTVEEALQMTPATLNSANTIIVATMQSFKSEDKLGRRVYRQNGALMSHFENLPKELRGEGSLVDVIRLRRPFVIVDEAHNQGTPLAVATLVDLNPSCVLELTATPDRAVNPSNVLCHVSAHVLRAEHMLKLPLILNTHPSWQEMLSSAIECRNGLEKKALAEHKATKEIISPIVMLIQAERMNQGKETFTADTVKKILMDDFRIPEKQIAIATGAKDELGDRQLGDTDYPPYIITVDKLREGWDCPNAYILFSFRNTTSATAVEQILGRVMRMPHVREHVNPELNQSYAYCASNDFNETARNLKDGLVRNGFERWEATEILRPSTPGEEDLFTDKTESEVVVSLPRTEDNSVAEPDQDRFAALPQSIKNKVELSPETRTMTFKPGLTETQAEKVIQTFPPKTVEKVRRNFEQAKRNAKSTTEAKPSPAESGVVARSPLLTFRQKNDFLVSGESFMLFDETVLLEAGWNAEHFDCKLSESEFSSEPVKIQEVALDVDQRGQISIDPYDSMDAQLSLLEQDSVWTVVKLEAWLNRQLRQDNISQKQLLAWLEGAINYLMKERGFSLERLVHSKFILREALRRKLQSGESQARQLAMEDLFEHPEQFAIRDAEAMEFKKGSYACQRKYRGTYIFHKHFFDIVGDFDSEPEEECAVFIDNNLRDQIEYWIRNIANDEEHSFWLQTAHQKFYPDFLVKLKTGVWLVVEYKGSDRASSESNQEKKRVGELWAEASEGKCKFAWVEDKNWSEISRVCAE